MMNLFKFCIYKQKGKMYYDTKHTLKNYIILTSIFSNKFFAKENIVKEITFFMFAMLVSLAEIIQISTVDDSGRSQSHTN